jgi:hypothetical protein
MGAHDRVPTLVAHKPASEPSCDAAMNVVYDTGLEIKLGSERRQMDA